MVSLVLHFSRSCCMFILLVLPLWFSCLTRVALVALTCRTVGMICHIDFKCGSINFHRGSDKQNNCSSETQFVYLRVCACVWCAYACVCVCVCACACVCVMYFTQTNASNFHKVSQVIFNVIFWQKLATKFFLQKWPAYKKSYLLFDNVINFLKNENKYLNIDTQSFYKLT